MNKVGLGTSGSFDRVKEFLTQHPFSDAPATLGAQATELDEVIAGLSTGTLDQEAGNRFALAHTASQRKLRSTLYTDHMQPISSIAREVFGATGMDHALRMPKPSVANEKVIASARAMAEVATKEKDVFIQRGLPADFIEQLTASATAFADARLAKTESNRRRVTATAAVKDMLKRGRKAVRLLNAILKPRLAKDPELLAAWRSAKRVPPQGISTLAVTAPATQVAPVAPAAQVGASQPSQSTTEKAA